MIRGILPRLGDSSLASRFCFSVHNMHSDFKTRKKQTNQRKVLSEDKISVAGLAWIVRVRY